MAVISEPMTEEQRAAQAAIIARQNDLFRTAFPFGGFAEVPGQVVCTPGVVEKGPVFLTLLQLTVAAFDTFTEENDPWGDHSFGVVEVSGIRVFWKIDLYDESYEFGAEEPANPERTRRVLTMLLPSEY